MLGLADRHDPGRLEAACARAVAVGAPSYRTVKGILAAGTETAPGLDPAGRPAGDGGAAAHLHKPWQMFADVIPLPTAGGTHADSPATTTTATSPDTSPTSRDSAS